MGQTINNFHVVAWNSIFIYRFLVHILLTWINFNPCRDKQSHTQEVWDEITYPSSNFSGCTIEIWEWISDVILYFIMDLITSKSGIEVKPCVNIIKVQMVFSSKNVTDADVTIHPNILSLVLTLYIKKLWLSLIFVDSGSFVVPSNCQPPYCMIWTQPSVGNDSHKPNNDEWFVVQVEFMQQPIQS